MLTEFSELRLKSTTGVKYEISNEILIIKMKPHFKLANLQTCKLANYPVLNWDIHSTV